MGANFNTTARTPLWLGRVTLASPNTNYSILALVNAVLISSGREAPGAFREILLTADPGVDSVGPNSNDILIGDANLSTSNYGWVLSPGSSTPFRSSHENVQFAGLYARSAGTNQHLCLVLMA